MRCPECGANGYRRKTRTPEWRCRKCSHEWDVAEDNPIVDGPVEPTQWANEAGYCAQCGSPIRYISAHFCTLCGAPILATPPDLTPKPASENPLDSVSNFVIVLIVVSMLGFIVLGFANYGCDWGDGKTDYERKYEGMPEDPRYEIIPDY